MSFFKDLKEDIAQSVNELTETLDENLSVDEKPEKEQDVLEKKEEEPVVETAPQEEEAPIVDLDVEGAVQPEELEPKEWMISEQESGFVEPQPELAEVELAEPEEELAEPEAVIEEIEPEEEQIVNEEKNEEMLDEVVDSYVEPLTEQETEEESGSDEVTVITKGTVISGGIKTDTSLVVKGTIEGDVECQGKLTITGKVSGNTIASEIYINTPRLEGDINSKGIVKIDVGTVVIGNVNCCSVLVAGAVKGDIEVNGPVIIDSTAVVKGDIKAKSIQINSGAVVDGHCSLQFADVDLDSFFE